MIIGKSILVVLAVAWLACAACSLESIGEELGKSDQPTFYEKRPTQEKKGVHGLAKIGLGIIAIGAVVLIGSIVARSMGRSAHEEKLGRLLLNSEVLDNTMLCMNPKTLEVVSMEDIESARDALEKEISQFVAEHDYLEADVFRERLERHRAEYLRQAKTYLDPSSWDAKVIGVLEFNADRAFLRGKQYFEERHTFVLNFSNSEKFLQRDQVLQANMEVTKKHLPILLNLVPC